MEHFRVVRKGASVSFVVAESSGGEIPTSESIAYNDVTESYEGLSNPSTSIA